MIAGSSLKLKRAGRHAHTCLHWKYRNPESDTAMSMTRRTVLHAIGSAALVSGSAFAQAPSGKVVRVVVPLPAGSSNDYVARAVLPAMANALGKPMVIDNKAGANGVIGTMEVVRAAPDGQTLLLSSNSALASNVGMVKNLPYDPRRDLTPIAAVGQNNQVIVVRADSKINTMADFVAYAKQRPGRVSFGSGSNSMAIMVASLGKLAGVELLTVPYKGTPAIVPDLIGGLIDATAIDPGMAASFVKSGQLRALAVSSLKRSPLTPDWPAVSETLPGYDFPFWQALVGPAGLPSDQVNALHAAVVQAQKDPAIVRALAQGGTVPLVMGPSELKDFMASEAAKWVRLTREANIQPE